MSPMWRKLVAPRISPIVAESVLTPGWYNTQLCSPLPNKAPATLSVFLSPTPQKKRREILSSPGAVSLRIWPLQFLQHFCFTQWLLVYVLSELVVIIIIITSCSQSTQPVFSSSSWVLILFFTASNYVHFSVIISSLPFVVLKKTVFVLFSVQRFLFNLNTCAVKEWTSSFILYHTLSTNSVSGFCSRSVYLLLCLLSIFNY